MAWTSMHFAVGMGCAGLAGVGLCAVLGRGWRWVPAAMTFGGIWAIAPDLPRFFRDDFPGLPLARTLGARALERTLHGWGDLFLFHHTLDAQPRELALHGFVLIVLLYNLALGLLMVLESRQRNSLGNRAWRAHAPHVNRPRPAGASPTPRPLRLVTEMRHPRSSHLARTTEMPG